MKMIVLPRYYRVKSYSLKKIGVYQIAWKKDDFLKLIRENFLNNVVILGCDVLEISNDGNISYTYDNFSISEMNSVNYEKYAQESKNKCEKYVRIYNENNRNIIYSPVFDKQIDNINYLDFIYIRWSFGGVLEPVNYPEIACQAIVKGEDHPAILELGSLINPILSDIEDVLNKYKNNFPILKKEELLRDLKKIASKIVDNIISPSEGASKIGWEFNYNSETPNILGTFLGLSVDYENDDDFQNKKNCEQKIIEEAKKVLDSNFNFDQVRQPDY